MTLKEQGEKWCILNLHTSSGYDEYPVSRPLVTITLDGEEFMVEFEFVKCFETQDLARQYLRQLDDGVR